MTIHKMLRGVVAADINTLPFNWADTTVEVPVLKLKFAIDDWVGEDVDEHTRQDHIDHSREWIETMRMCDEESEGDPRVNQIVAHIVWCMNLSSDWEGYASQTIYEAVATALLRKETSR